MKVKDNDKISIKLIFRENGKEVENNVATEQESTNSTNNNK